MRLTRLVPPVLPFATLLLAACEAAPPAGPAPDPAATGDACGAAALAAEFVGQDASVLLATTFTIPVRFIRPGDVVTLDFDPNRANFEIGADERVAGVRCG